MELLQYVLASTQSRLSTLTITQCITTGIMFVLDIAYILWL